MTLAQADVSIEFMEQMIILNRFEFENVFGKTLLEASIVLSHEQGMKAIKEKEPKFFELLKESKFRKPHHSLLYLKTVYTCEHYDYLQLVSMQEISLHDSIRKEFEKINGEGQ